MDTIPEKLKESGDLLIASGPGEYSKTLGVHWNTMSDTLHVSTPDIDPNHVVTKRHIASIVAKVFDVRGWFAPVILPVKILLQEIWKKKLSWDDPLPEEFTKRWKAWTQDLSLITTHPIPRCIGQGSSQVIGRQLHGFSDASVLAYGGVVYLRLLYADTCITIDLVLSKCKVAPLERRTIPRMELEGAVILSKLLEVAACDLNIPTSAIYAWTDSTIVLGWLIKLFSELKVYVAHRVEKITARVKKDQWRYVNTSCNPADILSRGIQPKDLLQMKTWWKGPPWLQLSLEDWPRRPDINFDRELPDLRKTVLLVLPPEEEFGIKFSSYVRLLRVFAWIRRFCEKARKLNKVPFSDYLTVLELCTVRNALFVVSQKFTYCHERLILMKNK